MDLVSVKRDIVSVKREEDRRGRERERERERRLLTMREEDRW
jgi:hypothetical protein